MADDKLTGLIDAIPPADEVRRQIAENLNRGKLLKKVLRMAEDRDRVLALSNCAARDNRGAAR